MSSIIRLSDAFFFGKRDRSRKARRGAGNQRSVGLRRSRVRVPVAVEFLEGRQLLSAIVTTDQSDYAPGSTAIFTAMNDANPGTDFQPGETVHFHIDRTDGVPIQAPPAIQDWDVTDGVGGFAPYQDSTGLWVFPDTDGAQNGSISASWYVDPQFDGASLQLVATGLTSGAEATTHFTDGQTISGLVYNDLNGDGQNNDGQVGLAGATITVHQDSDTGTTVGSVTTSTGGLWSFSGLASYKTYYVVETPPSGFNPTNAIPGGDANTTHVNNSELKVIAPTGNNSSTSNIFLNHQVSAATSTALASSANPSTYGQSVTFTATVSSTASPTGSVAFVIDGTSYAGTPGATTGTTATWTYTTSTLAASTTAHTVSANYTATGLFVNSSSTLTGGQTVNKATPTINWSSPASIVYGIALSGTQLNATATNPNNSATVTGTSNYTPTANTVLTVGNNQTLSVSFTPSDTTDYNTPAARTVSIDVTQAAPTFSNLSASQTITYGTSSIPVSGTLSAPTAIPVGETVTITIGTATANATVQSGGTFSTTIDTHALGASTTAYTITYSYAGSTNFQSAGDTSTTLAVNKASATVVVTGYSGPYDGAAHGVIGSSANGVNGEALTGLAIDPTTYTSVPGGPVHWTFSNANYADQSGDALVTISQVGSAVTVTWAGGTGTTYDGSSHGATASWASTGADGGGGELAVTYVGISGTTYSSSTAPTNAGSYRVTAGYAGDVNHAGSSGSACFTIAKADATVAVTGYTGGTYDGGSHTQTVTVTGVGGDGRLYTTGLTGTDAASYSLPWSYSADPNYNLVSGTLSFTIAKADASVVVNGYSGTYDGQPHFASLGHATGVGGADLSGQVDLGSSFTDYPGGTAHWTFSGGTNYNDQGGDVAIVINQAGSAVTVTWAGGTGTTYDGSSHGATASWASTGADGQSGALAVTYVGINGTTYSSSTAPTNAGSYRATAGYAGDVNHTGSSNSACFTIAQANATVAVTGYTGGTYDNSSHTQTVTVTGVGGDGQLYTTSLSGINARGYSLPWSYSADPNYNGVSGTLAFTIAKANATVVVTPYNVAYDTHSHTATYTVTGVGTDTVAAGSSVALNTTHTLAGIYSNDSWGFSGGINYNDIAVHTITDTITARCALVSYIGQTNWTTSGSSSTTAQVTLSASMQDPTGIGLVGATVTFKDILSGKILASGVPVSPVAGNPSTGTANTVVTLSSGQYGSSAYEIEVDLTGNYDNSWQAEAAKAACVVVSQPSTSNEIIGGGSISSGTAAGTYANFSDVTYSVGIQYNKSGTNLQGQIFLSIPQADGSTIYIKSNSLTSMAVTKTSGDTRATVYSKASIYRIDSTGKTISIAGNVTLRMDVDNSSTQGYSIGFTVLSSQDSSLYYSSDWAQGSTTGSWITVLQKPKDGSTIAIS